MGCYGVASFSVAQQAAKSSISATESMGERRGARSSSSRAAEEMRSAISGSMGDRDDDDDTEESNEDGDDYSIDGLLPTVCLLRRCHGQRTMFSEGQSTHLWYLLKWTRPIVLKWLWEY